MEDDKVAKLLLKGHKITDVSDAPLGKIMTIEVDEMKNTYMHTYNTLNSKSYPYPCSFDEEDEPLIKVDIKVTFVGKPSQLDYIYKNKLNGRPVILVAQDEV